MLLTAPDWQQKHLLASSDLLSSKLLIMIISPNPVIDRGRDFCRGPLALDEFLNMTRPRVAYLSEAEFDPIRKCFHNTVL